MEKIDLCIPAFNEGPILRDTLIELIPYLEDLPIDDWRIIVADNHSTDNTREIIEHFPHSRIMYAHELMSGKGAAVKRGALVSDADYFAYIDADLSAHPRHLRELLCAVTEGNDIAVGSRLMHPDHVHRSLWRTATALFFRVYAQCVLPVPVLDSQCGLKLMNKKGKETLLACYDNGWFFDREFLAKAAKRKLNIIELAVEWEEFRYSTRKSKLNIFKAGLQSLYKLVLLRIYLSMFK